MLIKLALTKEEPQVGNFIWIEANNVIQVVEEEDKTVTVYSHYGSDEQFTTYYVHGDLDSIANIINSAKNKR